ncbi:unnamed protein product [Prunus armeniaca]
MAHHLRKWPNILKISNTFLEPNPRQTIVKTKGNSRVQAAGSKTPFRPAPLPISFLYQLVPENKKGKEERALPEMEGVVETSCRKTLELQKILSHEGKWRRRLGKIGENQLGFIGKELPALVKGGISYPVEQHIQNEQASSLTARTFNFKPCSPIFFSYILANHLKHDQAHGQLHPFALYSSLCPAIVAGTKKAATTEPMLQRDHKNKIFCVNSEPEAPKAKGPYCSTS